MSESVGKKARFVETTVHALGLENVEVVNGRAEECLRESRVDRITGRALTPLDKFCRQFSGAIRDGASALLYKGPDVETELGAAQVDARKQRVSLRVIDRFELPEAMGTRTLVEVTAV